MIKVRYNSDEDLVKSIKDALVENQGYCPCAITKDKSTHCMCQEFRDFVKSGNIGLCHCSLYEAYKEEKENEQ